MDFTIRQFQDKDARSFLEVHHASVRGLAAEHYSSNIIEYWAQEPITHEQVDRVIRNDRSETRIVAETIDGLVGLACSVVSNSEICACYVRPTAVGSGVGRALILEIETRARNAGLDYLWADSTLNAVNFYQAMGYTVVGSETHWFTDELPAPCFRVEKEL